MVFIASGRWFDMKQKIIDAVELIVLCILAIPAIPLILFLIWRFDNGPNVFDEGY